MEILSLKFLFQRSFAEGNNPNLIADARKRLLKWLFAGLVLILAGCAVPKHMQVRTGDDPENIDKDVRFRTTYYFRVFDQCAPLKPAQLSNAKSDDPVFGPQTASQPVVLNDSLYRFRMTGKAHSLTSRARFESGTLKAFQIDPFGADIAFDDENERFYPVTQEETIRQAQQTKALTQIDRLLDLRKKLSDCTPKKGSINKQTGQEEPDDCIPKSKSIDKIDDLIARSIESLEDPLRSQKSTIAAATALTEVRRDKAKQLTEGIKEARGKVNNLWKEIKEGGKVVEWQGEFSQFPSTGTLETIAAFQEERKWYEGLLANAQKDLKKIQDEVKLMENESSGNFENETNMKMKYDTEKSQWEKIEPLSDKEKKTSNTCEDRSKRYLNAKEAYRKVKNITQISIEDKGCNPPKALYEDVMADKKKDDEALRTAAMAYDEEHQKMTEAVRDHKTAEKALKNAIEQLNKVHNRSFDTSKIQESRNTIEKNESDAKTNYETAASTAKTKRDAIAAAKLEQSLVEQFIKSLAKLSASFTLLSASLDPREQLADAVSASQACPEGTQRRRGFQIFGPQGFETFDQDERLVMAMSSSGKPLIGVMKELSARILNQKASESDRLLPYANERIKILKAHRIVDQTREGDLEHTDTLIQHVIEAFNGE